MRLQDCFSIPECLGYPLYNGRTLQKQKALRIVPQKEAMKSLDKRTNIYTDESEKTIMDSHRNRHFSDAVCLFLWLCKIRRLSVRTCGLRLKQDSLTAK